MTTATARVGEASGPYDIAELATTAEELANSHLDLGSVLVPVVEGGQVSVEMSVEHEPEAVYLLTPVGRVSVAAYAAPRSPGQWREVVRELSESVRAEGASTRIEFGHWGRELVAEVPGDETHRFIGVDGPRWMVRCVASGPVEAAEQLAQLARAVLAESVVRRGTDPYPPREPLPLILPSILAQQVRVAQQQMVDDGQLAIPPTLHVADRWRLAIELGREACRIREGPRALGRAAIEALPDPVWAWQEASLERVGVLLAPGLGELAHEHTFAALAAPPGRVENVVGNERGELADELHDVLERPELGRDGADDGEGGVERAALLLPLLLARRVPELLLPVHGEPLARDAAHDGIERAGGDGLPLRERAVQVVRHRVGAQLQQVGMRISRWQERSLGRCGVQLADRLLPELWARCRRTGRGITEPYPQLHSMRIVTTSSPGWMQARTHCSSSLIRRRVAPDMPQVGGLLR